LAKKKDPKKDAKKASNKPGGKSAAPPAPPGDADDDKDAQRRVALLRHKLTKAMDDPLMRDQIVRAIRAMMADGSK
jgi:hypothetical protein